MAVAVAVASILTADGSQGTFRTGQLYVVTGTLTLTGNYGTAGSHGDPVSFSGIDLIKSQYPPVWCQIRENQNAGQAPLGYEYIYNNGTNISNGVLQIIGGGGGATTAPSEYTNGTAYSSGTPSLNNAVLWFRAEFIFN